MIYVHSMDVAVRNYPEQAALSVGDVSLNFRQLQPHQEHGGCTQSTRHQPW